MQASSFIRPCRALPEAKGLLLPPVGAVSGGAVGRASGCGPGSGGGAAAASGAQQLGKNYFRATEKGSAVYKTGLPIPLGLELYDRYGGIITAAWVLCA